MKVSHYTNKKKRLDSPSEDLSKQTTKKYNYPHSWILT